jgi:hypothetical protein
MRREILEQNPSRCERRMPAQLDFSPGREPPQIVDARFAFHEKGGLGKIVLIGDRLHGGIGQPLFQRHDSGRVAAEGPLRERIDLPKLQFHSRLLRASILAARFRGKRRSHDRRLRPIIRPCPGCASIAGLTSRNATLETFT